MTGDERDRILGLLSGGPAGVARLAAGLGLPGGVVSYQLKLLEREGLVRVGTTRTEQGVATPIYVSAAAAAPPPLPVPLPLPGLTFTGDRPYPIPVWTTPQQTAGRPSAAAGHTGTEATGYAAAQTTGYAAAQATGYAAQATGYAAAQAAAGYAAEEIPAGGRGPVARSGPGGSPAAFPDTPAARGTAVGDPAQAPAAAGPARAPAASPPGPADLRPPAARRAPEHQSPAVARPPVGPPPVTPSPPGQLSPATARPPQPRPPAGEPGRNPRLLDVRRVPIDDATFYEFARRLDALAREFAARATPGAPATELTIALTRPNTEGAGS